MSDLEPLEVTPQDVHSRRLNGEPSALIDVREPEEFALSHIDGAEPIPMQSIPARLQRLETLSDSGPLFILCHHGVRSLQVASWLRANGIENCASIMGGIDRWSREIDSSVPRY